MPLNPRGQGEVQSLIMSAEDLVEKVLVHLGREGLTGLDTDDLRAFGHQGLCEAALRYDPEAGVEFRRYAYYRVRGAILDGMRKMGTWSRRGYERVAMLRSFNEVGFALSGELGQESQVSGQDAAERLRKHMAQMVTAMTVGVFSLAAHDQAEGMVAVDGSQNAEEQLAELELSALIRSAMEELPPPEDEVVRRFYVEGEKMDVIADDLGRSRSWVSRMHTRALSRMGARLRAVEVH